MPQYQLDAADIKRITDGVCDVLSRINTQQVGNKFFDLFSPKLLQAITAHLQQLLPTIPLSQLENTAMQGDRKGEIIQRIIGNIILDGLPVVGQSSDPAAYEKLPDFNVLTGKNVVATGLCKLFYDATSVRFAKVAGEVVVGALPIAQIKKRIFRSIEPIAHNASIAGNEKFDPDCATAKAVCNSILASLLPYFSNQQLQQYKQELETETETSTEHNQFLQKNSRFFSGLLGLNTRSWKAAKKQVEAEIQRRSNANDDDNALYENEALVNQ